MTSRLATDAEVATWRDEGWVLLEGLVGTEEIEPWSKICREIFPSAEEHQADPEGVSSDEGAVEATHGGFVWPDEGPGSAPLSSAGRPPSPSRAAGPSTGSACMPLSSISPSGRSQRRYPPLPAHASAKYAGVTNYEQPIHIDRNHSWLPPANESPWWNLEGFLYLTDVTEDDNSTRLVSVRDTEEIDNPYGLLMPRGDPEVSPPSGRAAGIRGSIWPTARTRITGEPRSARAPGPTWPSPSHSRTPPSNGSATTPSRADRPGPSGPPSSRAHRHGSWRSSAGPVPVIRSGTSACSNGPRTRYPALDLGSVAEGSQRSLPRYACLRRCSTLGLDHRTRSVLGSVALGVERRADDRSRVRHDVLRRAVEGARASSGSTAPTWCSRASSECHRPPAGSWPGRTAH